MAVKTKTSNQEYFPALTGIRAIAAYLVFFHHFNPFQKNESTRLLFGLFNEMYIGVTVFFVLSGFLIGYRYFETENFNFKKYITNRIARIYPMYFLLTILTFSVFYFSDSSHSLFSIKVFLLNITFLKGLFGDFVFTGINQGWSLTVEEMFYFSAPLFFILIHRSRFFLIFLPVFLLSFGFLLTNYFNSCSLSGFFVSNKFMLNYTLFGRCFEFFIGISLSIFYKRNKNKIKSGYSTYTGLLIIISSLFLLNLLKGDYKYGIMNPFGILINNLFLPFCGISLLFWGLLREQTFVQNILSSNLFVILGKSSYIFYLIHLGVIEYFIQKNITSNIYLIFLLINIISILLFKIIEEPLNNLIRKKFA